MIAAVSASSSAPAAAHSVAALHGCASREGEPCPVLGLALGALALGALALDARGLVPCDVVGVAGGSEGGGVALGLGAPSLDACEPEHADDGGGQCASCGISGGSEEGSADAGGDGSDGLTRTVWQSAELHAGDDAAGVCASDGAAGEAQPESQQASEANRHARAKMLHT